METTRFFRPKRRRRDFSDQGGDGATFQTGAETARLRNNSLRPWWMRRDFSNQIGNELSTVHTARLSRKRTETPRLSGARRRRRDISDQDGDGATLKKVFQGFLDRGGDGATFATKVDTARLKRQLRSRFGQRDKNVLFQDFRDRGGDGATFQTEAETTRPIIISLRPCWKRRKFRAQGGNAAVFQTKAETARLFRPRRRRRDFPDRDGDGATKKQFFATLVDAARF